MSDGRDLRRTDDYIVKHWEVIAFVVAIVFYCGGWYTSSQAKAIVSEAFQKTTTETLADHNNRLTRVEDAVLYMKEIVKEDRRNGSRGR